MSLVWTLIVSKRLQNGRLGAFGREKHFPISLTQWSKQFPCKTGEVLFDGH